MEYISQMPKSPKTIRKEVHLMPAVVKELEALAKKENRSLKNYMENIILNHVDSKKQSR